MESRTRIVIILSGVAVSLAFGAGPLVQKWEKLTMDLGMPTGLILSGSNLFAAGEDRVRLFDTDGNADWTYILPSAVTGCGMARAGGYLYLGGNKETPDSIWMAELDPSTQQTIWERCYSEGTDIEARDVAVLGDYFYAAGKIMGTTADDFFILERVRATGAYSYNWDFEEDFDEEAYGITADSKSIYATGKIDANGWTIKIPINPGLPGWVPEWQKIFGSGIGDMFRDIAVDLSGNPCIAGWYQVVKYSPDGNVLWSKFDTCLYFSVTYDAQGNVYAAGCAENPDTNIMSGVISKYSPSGTLIWRYIDDSPYRAAFIQIVVDGNDIYTFKVINAIAVDANMDAIPAYLVKFTDASGVEETSRPSSALELEVECGSIFYSLPASLPVSLKLYDASGRLCSTLMPFSISSQGTHRLALNTRGLARGCYFVRLETPEAALSRKIVIH